MVRTSCMLIAGEPSGDQVAAQLVQALRPRMLERLAVPTEDCQPLHTTLEPEFFGAGGPKMAAAGVRLAIDMTEHAVVGLWEVMKKYRDFQRLFRTLTRLAIRRQPDVIICVDFSGFNLRFAAAIRRHVRRLEGTFGNWRPRLVQYVSPQVWASRPQRAQTLARDVDLLLSILPFEAQWYAGRVPHLPVQFVGHPLVDRYAATKVMPEAELASPLQTVAEPHVVLLPGSRVGEIRRHLPVMLDALAKLQARLPGLSADLVLPDETLAAEAQAIGISGRVHLQVGNLGAVLRRTHLAIASTGTVTLELAYFGVPTVAMYKTSWATYEVAKRLVKVKYLAMPNLMAGEEIFPEFIQHQATADNVADAALRLLQDAEARSVLRTKLRKIVRALGPPGATERAADAIVALLAREPKPFRAALSG